MLASSMQFSSYDRSLVFSPHLIVIWWSVWRN